MSYVAMAKIPVLAIVVLMPLVASHLNVFISQAEVMKLLGLQAELYYVRDGAVNAYAMNFVVPVPAHIADLEFSWQSLTKKPLPYLMSIDYESHGAMLPPQVNISERGLVPTTVQTFRVRLPCTGVRSAEIEVKLQLNISGPDRARRDTLLNFRRNKICLKGQATPPLALNESARMSEGGSGSVGGSGASGRVLYVAAGCAAAAIALLAAAAAASSLYSRGNKARNHDSVHTSYTTAAYGSHQNVVLRLDALGRPPSASGSYATIASLHKFPFGSRRSPSPYATTHIGAGETHVYAKPDSHVSYYASSHLTHVSHVSKLSTASREQRLAEPYEQLRHLATARGNIRPEVLLHEGTFGRLYHGVLKRGDHYEDVIVKTVSEAASQLQCTLLTAEGVRLAGMTHPALLTPAAAVLDDPRRPVLAYAAPAHTLNLKRFLTSCRLGMQCAPVTRELVAAGAQAASGLSFLHTQRVLHRDIAARNCVVDEHLQLKITDNALSRDLFPTDYHCLGDNENRPVKWLAAEALLHNQYSTASDVWAMGVLLWELATLAQQPLAEVDPFEVGAFVRDGYRPDQPLNCPDELFGMMCWCWAAAASARPAAAQLLACLQDFHDTLAEYI